MTVADFVKTNTQILTMCHLDFKLFNINREGNPLVFDSTKDSFHDFVYYCDRDIDHWFYYNDGKEKAFWLYIDGDDD